mmetsp:Transcript_47294/g.82386  ORF Transcript_47294/g.82386 Transcript_47294/m.82386 type:complete len:189 (-) Transcript_47294:85-651(-)
MALSSTMLTAFLLAFVGSEMRCAAAPTASESAPKAADAGPKATAKWNVHRYDGALRTSMRDLMHDEEDEDDDAQFSTADQDRPSLLPSDNKSKRGGFLQVSSGQVLTNGQNEASISHTRLSAALAPKDSMSDYLQESEMGLSAALGPRWDARKLEKDADESSKALLEGIGGSRALRVLNGMAGALNLR